MKRGAKVLIFIAVILVFGLTISYLVIKGNLFSQANAGVPIPGCPLYTTRCYKQWWWSTETLAQRCNPCFYSSGRVTNCWVTMATCKSTEFCVAGNTSAYCISGSVYTPMPTPAKTTPPPYANMPTATPGSAFTTPPYAAYPTGVVSNPNPTPGYGMTGYPI